MFHLSCIFGSNNSDRNKFIFVGLKLRNKKVSIKSLFEISIHGKMFLDMDGVDMVYMHLLCLGSVRVYFWYRCAKPDESRPSFQMACLYCIDGQVTSELYLLIIDGQVTSELYLLIIESDRSLITL